MTAGYRVVVVGGGMAGASLGYELARDHAVTVLEAAALPAQHSTGRSAALFFAAYGPAAVRAATDRSRPLFDELERTLATPRLLAPRGALLVATTAEAEASLEAWVDETDLCPVTSARAAELCPALDSGQVLAAAFDPAACDIDVLALHDGYLRGLRARGGEIAWGADVCSAERTSTGWRVRSSDGRMWEADVVVNAAGAWGDDVWRSFDAPAHGLRPCRRTVAVARASTPVARDWPIVGDAAQGWYFRPEGSGVLLSPGDETASVPRDEKPDQIELARAIDAVNDLTTLGIRSVVTTWAGQRTFTADRLPVVGPVRGDDSLFSFVGQGGYGIQLAPALARAAAQLVSGEPVTACDLTSFSPDRAALRTASASQTTPV